MLLCNFNSGVNKLFFIWRIINRIIENVCGDSRFTRTRDRFSKIQIEMSFALKRENLFRAVLNRHIAMLTRRKKKGHISVFSHERKGEEERG